MKQRKRDRKRRGRGEGAVFQRVDGLWSAVLSLGYDGQGRRYRRTVYGRTKADALERLAQARTDSLNGIEPSAVILSTFLNRWLEDVVKPAVRESTYERHEGNVRVHITPRIGGVKLSKFTPLHVQDLLTRMEKDGVSPGTRLRVFSVLHAALQQALRWGMVLRNPCDAVKRPRNPRKIPETLTMGHLVKFFRVAQRSRLHALYVLAATTGLRQGEIFGLRWPDVDFKESCVYITQGGNGDTKTDAGRRRVDLPTIAADALREHRKRMLAEGHKKHNGLVFVDTQGGALRKSNFIRKSFHPLLTEAELPRIRFHDLRHSHATHLLQENVHPKVVQERLGHSSIKVTMDLYSHVMPSLAKETVTRLDALYYSLTTANNSDNAGHTGTQTEAAP